MLLQLSCYVHVHVIFQDVVKPNEIPMTRPNKPDIPLKGTILGMIGIYHSQIRPADHDIQSGQRLAIAG